MAPSREIEKLQRRWQENPMGLTFAPLAEAYRKEGMHGEALELLEIGLSQHPDYIPAHIVRGRCLFDTRADGAAEESFRRVVELDAENVIALKGLADIAERAGRPQEAIGQLERLLLIDPGNDDASAQLAGLRASLDRPAADAGPIAMPPGPAPEALATIAGSPFEAPAQTAAAPPSPAAGSGSSQSAASDRRSEEAAAPPTPTQQPGPPLYSEFYGTPESAMPEVLDEGEAEEPEASIAEPREQVDVVRYESVELSSSSSYEFQRLPDSDQLRPAAATGGGSRHDYTQADPRHHPDPHRASEQTGGDLPADSARAEAPPEAKPVTAAESESPPIPEPALGSAPEPEPPPIPEPVSTRAEGQAPPIAEPLSAGLPEPEPPPAPVPGWSATASGPAGPFETFAEIDVVVTEVGANELAGDDDELTSLDDLPEVEAEPVDVAVDDAEAVAGVEADPELVVTETMAEIFLRQGHRELALAVYTQLAGREPGNERIRVAIEELESELRPAAGTGLPAYAAVLTGGQSVRAYFERLLSATRPAPADPAEAERLSLGAVFGDDPGTAATGAPAAEAGPSYDEFYSDDAPPADLPAGSPADRERTDPTDLESFTAWLKGLKR